MTSFFQRIEPTRLRTVVPLASLLAAAACASGARVPSDAGATATSSENGRPPAPPAIVQPAQADYSPADVRFMQGMIVHHAQALVMTALVEDRTSSARLLPLAGRIEVSQDDEIAQMRRWLEKRGEAVPAIDEHAGHAQHGGASHTRMPGMASPEEMARLAAASGAAFDRLFLELMIRHHEGALVMVEELFAEDAGLQPEIFTFASHVDADQRAEIARMRRMLESLEARG